MVCHIDCQTPAMSRGVLSRWPSLVGGINSSITGVFIGMHWCLSQNKGMGNNQDQQIQKRASQLTAPCMHIFVYVQTVCMYVYIYINVQYYTHIEETNVIIDIWTHQPQRGGWTSPASTRTQMFGRFSRVSSSFVRRCTSFHLPQMQKGQPQNKYK